MPDLDFRALREEAERVTLPPEFGVVEQRLSRNRRRRARYAVATVALGTAAALAIGLGLAQGPPQSSPGVELPTGPGGDGFAPEVQFIDTEHGLAEYYLSGMDCRAAIRTTQDGGKTWSKVRYSPRITDANGQCASRAQLVDGDTIVVPRMPVDVQPVISRDAGKTWQPYESQVRTVDSVPEGVTPAEICLSNKECNQEGYGRLGWVDPATGDRMVLRTSPPDMKHVGEPFVARNGSIWTVEPSGDRPVELTVAVSRDHGRTWRTMTTPDRGHLVSYDGETGYFMTFGPQVQLLRTRDGGATWQQVKDVRFDGKDLVWIDVMWVAADGALVVGGYADGDPGPGGKMRWRVSRDGGKTFQAIDLPSDLAFVSLIPGGFHGWDISGSLHYVSQDGLTWRKATPPRLN